MDKMLVIPDDRPRLKPWMLCVLMGVTALALLPVIAPHRPHVPTHTRADPAPAAKN